MKPLIIFFFCFFANVTTLFAQVIQSDAQNLFSVSRPTSWVIQQSPAPAIRIMLGFDEDLYVGNCNISVVPSPSTSRMSQSEVDVLENKRLLRSDFFQSRMSSLANDLRVISAIQTKRGMHFGHLVNYTYSYISPNVNRRIFVRAELFSHSRPGNVFSFTCTVAATKPSYTSKGFDDQLLNFTTLSSSLKFHQ
jgi:hypothetical protein